MIEQARWAKDREQVADWVIAHPLRVPRSRRKGGTMHGGAEVDRGVVADSGDGDVDSDSAPMPWVGRSGEDGAGLSTEPAVAL